MNYEKNFPVYESERSFPKNIIRRYQSKTNRSLSLDVLADKNSWYEGTWEIIGKVGE